MCSNSELINYLIDTGWLKSPAVIAAFQAIDRKDFIGPHRPEWAYEDCALYIGYKATISQPSTVAFMLEQLGVQLGDKILDIGAGSGWTTALLVHIAGASGYIYGIEIVPELVEFAKYNLAKYPLLLPHAQILRATEQLGYPAEMPYNKILVSASAKTLPKELLTQLLVGGTLVIPIQQAIWKVTKTSANNTAIQKYPGFSFVPLQG